MPKLLKRVTTTSTWAASSTLAGVDLPREGLVTQVMFRQDLTLNGGTWGTTVQPDGPWRAVDEFKIEGDGGRNFFSLGGEQGGRLWALQNIFEFGGPLVTELSATAESFCFIFHPGSNFRDPFDTSVVIPAQDLATLQARWTTGANNIPDDTQTISSGTGYFTVWQVTGVPRAAGKTMNIKVPLGSTLKWPHDANYTDLGKEFDVPTGNWLRRIILLVQDDTATRPLRAQDQVTAVGLKIPKLGMRVIDTRWVELQAATAARYGYVGTQFQVADVRTGHLTLPDGFAILDLREYFHPVYGLNLKGYQTGDVKLAFTVENYTSGDDTYIYYDVVADW